jgi:hypothetical protein
VNQNFKDFFDTVEYIFIRLLLLGLLGLGAWALFTHALDLNTPTDQKQNVPSTSLLAERAFRTRKEKRKKNKRPRVQSSKLIWWSDGGPLGETFGKSCRGQMRSLVL